MKKKKILVVDNDRDFCFVISQLLRDEDYRVNVVYSGEAALRRIEKEHFDSMLLDYNLPGIDGLDVLKKVRQEGYPVQTVMVSGNMDYLLKEAARKAGASSVLDKPFNTEELFSVLEKISEERNYESKKVYT